MFSLAAGLKALGSGFLPASRVWNISCQVLKNFILALCSTIRLLNIETRYFSIRASPQVRTFFLSAESLFAMSQRHQGLQRGSSTDLSLLNKNQRAGESGLEIPELLHERGHSLSLQVPSHPELNLNDQAWAYSYTLFKKAQILFAASLRWFAFYT